MTFIKCRARVAEDCLHDQPSRRQFGVGYMEGVIDPPLWEDGTYDGVTHSIVCDRCFAALGVPRNQDLPAAIERARAG